MALLAGIIGLAQSGKTAIFNALTSSGSPAEGAGPSSKHPNMATIHIPDPRLDDLSLHFKSKKLTPATLEFVDLPGLRKGATGDETKSMLSQVKEADLFIQIVRCFENDTAPHPEGSLDPLRDIESLNFELLIADLATVEKRIDRISKLAKSGDEKARAILALMEKLKVFLEEGKPLRLFHFKEEELKLIADVEFLSGKPVMYVANLNEDNAELSEKLFKMVEDKARSESAFAMKIFGKVEAELAELPPEERKEFLGSYGLESSGLDRLIQVAFQTLDLMTFLTAGEKETRGWTIRKGIKAPQAAGKIHSDIERGFIRVEVYTYDDWVKCGKDEKKVKEKGLFRVEGKEYIIKEGDICLFRFNV
jgi:ribosome-binding ATPase